MKKIAFICPYFGKLPNHCQLWLNSCEKNKDITWFLLTDDKTNYKYPSNVIVKYTSLEKLREEYQKKFDFKISLPGVYKLGDYKPLLGYLHEELIKEYDAWGHIDVSDEIYGDIRKFVTDDLLDKYDKIMFFGHMSIYKNTTAVNKRFMEQSDISLSYKQVLSSDKFYNFEEFAPGSITRIYTANKWPICRLDEYIADISGISYAFKLGRWSDDFNKLKYYKRIPLIFSWENGKVFGYSIENKKIVKKEYLYVHFKRRKMILAIDNDEQKYLIVPDGFKKMPEEITKEIIRNNSKNKLVYDVYIKEKRKALNVRINQLIECIKNKNDSRRN